MQTAHRAETAGAFTRVLDALLRRFGLQAATLFSWPEIERPAILNVETSVPFVTVDGVQGWRNPTLVGWPGIHISLPDNVAVLIAARSN